MTRRLTPAEVGDTNIEMAAHPRTAGPALSPFAGSAEFMQLPARTRVVPDPAPVDVSAVSGRPAEAWEQGEIMAARERERRLEWRP